MICTQSVMLTILFFILSQFAALFISVRFGGQNWIRPYSMFLFFTLGLYMILPLLLGMSAGVCVTP